MLERLYGHRPDYDKFRKALLKELKTSWRNRSADLKRLDLQRDLEPDWFQRSNMVGYSCYTDRFTGKLADVSTKIPYLQNLGVNYLHLLPCLKPRPRPNDGGYSVQDYRAINPELGTMDDLADLATNLREAGMSLCIDLVLNHTAQEHEWAEKARAGDPYFQDFYYFFEDDSEPKEFEENLVEIFPNDAPGNFTYLPDINKWVWTTFNTHQWDLNWSNPWVFLEIVKVTLFLANQGVDVLRLDAVAFMWKRKGTRCQSEPEVHMILRALRAASRIASASVIHLEEAITGPAEMLTYFGRGENDGREGNLAYHNSLMVQFWGALATQDTRLMRHVLAENFPETLTNATYTTYLRCHDDIGWAVTDEDASAVGISGQLHREYLSKFYTGEIESSFARGEYFQVNEETGDSRISGTLAALAGLEKALDEHDKDAEALAVHRMLLGTALIASYGGIPLIFMGDEIAMLNAYDYAEDTLRAHDSRWLHRPEMDWDRAQAQFGAAKAVLDGTSAIMKRRKETPQLHGAVPTRILFPDAPEIFAFRRYAATGPVICLFNFSDRHVDIPRTWLLDAGVTEHRDLLSGGRLTYNGESFGMLPYARVWAV